MSFPLVLNDEERQRAEKFAQECMEKAHQIEAIFSKDTRGMMQFMYAISILRASYPKIVDNHDAPTRVAEWLAAGEPENLAGIVDKIMERFMGRPN